MSQVLLAINIFQVVSVSQSVRRLVDPLVNKATN